MLHLYIGNKNYSSWSLRPWLLMKQAGIPFEETVIPLYAPEGDPIRLRVSPSGKLPVLHDGERAIWDSLAICEYLAERHPDKALWPSDPAARAEARSISAEMHSGFQALRGGMPMNVRGRHPGYGHTPEVLQDIARIEASWNDCRARHSAGGPFLFGEFSIADAMYAPVVWRLTSYGVTQKGAAATYIATMLALPAMRDWADAAQAEPWRIDHAEPIPQPGV